MPTTVPDTAFAFLSLTPGLIPQGLLSVFELPPWRSEWALRIPRRFPECPLSPSVYSSNSENPFLVSLPS